MNKAAKKNVKYKKSSLPPAPSPANARMIEAVVSSLAAISLARSSKISCRAAVNASSAAASWSARADLRSYELFIVINIRLFGWNVR